MADLITYHPEPDELAYTFGGRPPVARLRGGDVLRVRTEDCFGGAVRTVKDLPSQVCRMPYLNPVSGPFAIDGAEPGDTLAVHFASITPARDWAVSATFPHFGALTSTGHTPTLQPALEERVWLYELDRAAAVARFRAGQSDFTVELPMDPMHGTVGVAPAAFEVRSTITPDMHGGNMDTAELRAGVTAYFGVNVPGAMLALGDGHARQGDGEACGVAVECAMETVLAVEVIKGVSTPWPRLESDTHLMSTGSARPLEDAYRIGFHDLTTWVSGLTGLELLDAYQLLTQVGQAPVGNVCDPLYTMVAKVDKRWLPAATAYDGAHQRLRRIAATVDPAP